MFVILECDLLIDSLINVGPIGFVPKDTIGYNLSITGKINSSPPGNMQFCKNGYTPKIGQLYVQDRPNDTGNVWDSDIAAEVVNSSIAYEFNLNKVSIICFYR